MSSICELPKGPQKPHGNRIQFLEMNNRIKSGGIGELEMIYMDSYPN
jgi:hypothetical protein